MLPTYASFSAFGYGQGEIMATDRTKVRFASLAHRAAPSYTCWSAMNKSANQASGVRPECQEMRVIHK
jgi:hypothetical protein